MVLCLNIVFEMVCNKSLNVNAWTRSATNIASSIHNKTTEQFGKVVSCAIEMFAGLLIGHS